ncbi:MAG: bactofilin family protein [Luteibaculaceae bacterium]
MGVFESKNSKSGSVVSPESLNRIVHGTSISGEINSEGNIRIDGKVEGTIKTKGRLVIGETGFVKGNIFCQEADIEGKFEGNIQVNGLLSLKSKSSITGDANFTNLLVEEGAKLSCTCNINQKKTDVNLNGKKVELQNA